VDAWPRVGRGGAGLLGVGPGLLVGRLAGRLVERDDALARLRYVRAGAEVPPAWSWSKTDRVAADPYNAGATGTYRTLSS
jgi:hypothetical protein